MVPSESTYHPVFIDSRPHKKTVALNAVGSLASYLFLDVMLEKCVFPSNTIVSLYVYSVLRLKISLLFSEGNFT